MSASDGGHRGAGESGAGEWQGATLRGAFETALRKYRHRVAVETDGTEYTYGELDRRANAIANGLAEQGIGPGDRVALLMANRVEFVVMGLALNKAGAVMLPLNSMLTNDEYEYMLSDAGAETVVAGPYFLDRVAGISEAIPAERFLAIGTEDRDLPEGFADADELDGDPDAPPDVSLAPADVAGHFYTGGTTGKPKGVIHTHRAMTMNAYSHVMELEITGEDSLLLMTPLTHSAGLFLWAALLSGATCHVRSGFDPGLALSEIAEYGITWTFMVPTMIYRTLDHEALETTDTSSLSTLIYGAAPMTAGRLREGIEAFGPVFAQFYGQTECPNLITSMGKAEHRMAVASGDGDGNDGDGDGGGDRSESDNGSGDGPGEELLSSAGQSCLMTDVRIVDPQTGEPVGVNEEGEIAVSAPYTLTEYHDLPEKTDEALDNGWLRTGDLGRIDRAGYVSLLDRKSDMIITGGINVYSTNVEEALDEHPDVGQVAVIGVPDEKWGEAVTAIVVPREEGAVSEAEIKEFADGRLADYKKPKTVEFVSNLPTTPYGKVDKQALREPYWEGEEREIG
jgi:fatty-acyl-CoA synthase/long-chain acyl-CoA synthetase